MRLTILGCGAALMPPGGACSGYLVEDGETRLLLECGTGVLSNLQRVADFRTVSAVVISHCHADHWFDLVPYRYGIQLSRQPVAHPPLLFLPPGGGKVLGDALAFLDPTGAFFSSVFPLAEYNAAAGLTVGSLELSFRQSRHVVPSWAIRVNSGRHSLTFSSDTGPSDAVAALARGTDLLLCEAALQGPGEESTAGLHLTAMQAGDLAAQAGAKRLLLTHIWPELDPAVSLAEARQRFENVALAEGMATFEIA